MSKELPEQSKETINLVEEFDRIEDEWKRILREKHFEDSKEDPESVIEKSFAELYKAEGGFRVEATPEGGVRISMIISPDSRALMKKMKRGRGDTWLVNYSFCEGTETREILEKTAEELSSREEEIKEQRDKCEGTLKSLEQEQE